MRRNEPVYVLKDWSGESIKGAFTSNEIQRLSVDANTQFKIGKILRRRTREGKKEAYIKFIKWSHHENNNHPHHRCHWNFPRSQRFYKKYPRNKEKT